MPAAFAASEAELAAASLALLGQPGLWPGLALPPPTPGLADTAPWTAYWATRLAPALAPPAARVIYARCLPRFAEPEARWGRLLCIAAAIDGFYVDEGPLDPMDEWIARLQADWPPPGTDWPTAELQARVMACGVGLLLRQPDHPWLPGWAEAAMPLMRRLAPGPGRLKLATFLVQHHVWRGDFARTALLIESTPGLDPAHLLPDEAMVWHESVATHARFTGQPALGMAAVQSALALVHRHGLDHHAYALHAHGASLALDAGEAPQAAAHLDAMRPVLAGRPQADQTHYWHFQTGLHLLRGDTAAAVESARATLANSGEIGGPYRSASHHLSLGQALLAQGHAADALAPLRQAEALARGIDARLVASTALWMQAAVHLATGDEAAALPPLRAALADFAAHDDRALSGWWLPGVAGNLLRLALAHGIEPAWVRRFARRRGLPGTDPALAAWPWTLVLRGFGDFEVRLHDEPLPASGPKAAQRPLDLLRALLAHGAQPLPVATLLDWLWPEAEPAAQRKAFDVALLRLRRLLADDRLLRLDGARLSLAAEWVWSDVGALSALTHRIGHAHDAPTAQLRHWADELLDLMRGPLLPDTPADWAQAARERYRQRFVVTVGQLAARLEQQDDDEAAIGLYQRALDIDPLAESLARRLMRLHAERGDRAEALRVLRGCCTMLKLGAGLGPSRETRALAAELGLPLP